MIPSTGNVAAIYDSTFFEVRANKILFLFIDFFPFLFVLAEQEGDLMRTGKSFEKD
jgi:hypothetical protein